jgi:hypothetical protein
MVKESAVAKSTGKQDQNDIMPQDRALLSILYSEGKKISKPEAEYRITSDRNNKPSDDHCMKCKFNLGDEQRCHVVRGKINNKYGISKFFSSRGEGMLPGDLVWEYVKKTGKKLKYTEGHVIKEGARGFQCKDCKYFLYNGGCLIIKGKFKPKMSCGFVVKIGQGTVI